MTSPSRTHLATKTITFKRVTASNGISGLPTAHLSDQTIKCTPLMAMDENVMGAARQQEPGSVNVKRKMVMIFGSYDIQSGDTGIIDGAEYPIFEVNPWSVTEPFMTLVLNEPQGPVPADSEFVR